MSGASNTIVGGQTGGFNFIGSGSNNVIFGTFNSILDGINNLIDSSSSTFSSILGGSNNTIFSSSSNSLIGTGINNGLTGNNSGIMCGLSNRIVGGQTGFNFIGSGSNNLIFGNFNSILDGCNNVIDTITSQFNSILAGNNNRIAMTSLGSMIGSGSNNQIVLADNSVIVTGNGNTGDSRDASGYLLIGCGSNNIVRGSFNAIVSGDNNTIDSSLCEYNTILNGESNRIQSLSRYSFIGSGINNQIQSSPYSAIISGSGNVVGLTGIGGNVICSGISNNLVGGYNSIVSGSNNIIDSSNVQYSVIVSGQQNRISSGVNSIIGAGSNNQINDSNAGIMCGSGNIIGLTGINSCIGSGINNRITIANSFASGEDLELTQSDFPCAAFGRSNLEGITGTGASGGFRVFMVGIGSGTRRNGFSVNDKGICFAAGNFVTSGADFAEYFESHSSYSEKFPCCESVCIIDERFIGKEIDQNKQFVSSPSGFTINQIGKIMLSKDVPEEIEPFGIVVKDSGFVGNAHEEEWRGKYERDEFGNIVYDIITNEKYVEDYNLEYKSIEKESLDMKVNQNGEIEYIQSKITESIPYKIPIFENYPVYDFSGNLVEYVTKPKLKKIISTQSSPRISPLYDESQLYVPRSQRPEWNLIALLGQVYLNHTQRLHQRWKKMSSVNNKSVYLIK